MGLCDPNCKQADDANNAALKSLADANTALAHANTALNFLILARDAAAIALVAAIGIALFTTLAPPLAILTGIAIAGLIIALDAAQKAVTDQVKIVQESQAAQTEAQEKADATAAALQKCKDVFPDPQPIS